jgi:hypothetical protein
VLHPRQCQVGHVASLAGGAPAEEAGAVADHRDDQIGLPRGRGGRPDPGPVLVAHRAALVQGQLGGGELLPQSGEQGVRGHAEAELRMVDEHVVGVGVAAQ